MQSELELGYLKHSGRRWTRPRRDPGAYLATVGAGVSLAVLLVAFLDRAIGTLLGG